MNWWRTRESGSAAWLYFQAVDVQVEVMHADSSKSLRNVSPHDQARAVLKRSIMSARHKLEKVDALPAGSKLLGKVYARGGLYFEYYLGPF